MEIKFCIFLPKLRIKLNTNTNKLTSLRLGYEWQFKPNHGLTGNWENDGIVYDPNTLINNYNGTTMNGVFTNVDRKK